MTYLTDHETGFPVTDDSSEHDFVLFSLQTMCFPSARVMGLSCGFLSLYIYLGQYWRFLLFHYPHW